MMPYGQLSTSDLLSIPVSCEGTVRLLGAVQGDGPGSPGFYLNPWVLGLGTTEKAWALQHRVFKGLPK